MKSRKNEDRDYLKQFQSNEQLSKALQFLSTEASKLKKLIQDIVERAKGK
ncbi:hypothetical protein GAP32_073 [Cronobacter phage vB_CsaM_GAP32]|uniref:Uncharacterized protein n=1 Tax=Cronobacter phage vB_CsaM_GAP32 TaxID=1141136 RepID=K4F5N9_9CAUD|nr:hypothetical protein GAP32_073 [Cronobacter phage vB_CsaM_GAP32]AFC21521.1 hypothetical protein GAP32_073 [Cronobacter phage vB_CsaM_GAP32]